MAQGMEQAAGTPTHHREGDVLVDLGGGVSMEFVRIPTGKFVMGSPPDDRDRQDEEVQRRVVLTRGFCMGRYPVTQEQWLAVMGSSPCVFKGHLNPAESVSWDDARAFLDTASANTNKAMRLPTEAEWEYACRAGTTTRFYAGESEADLAQAGWYAGNSEDRTHPVGQKHPNQFGLYDMLGNVWEWCSDWYGDRSSEDATDPHGPESGTFRVFRGGCWCSHASSCRAAYRGLGNPVDGGYGMGFRVVLPLVGS